MKLTIPKLSLCAAIVLTMNPLNLALAENLPSTTKTDKKSHENYDITARGIHKPMYDYYAHKIKQTTQITKGICLDVGSGGGYMGLSLAQITDLDFIFLDISEKALEKAKQHIIEDSLQARAKTLLADVHAIPLDDNSIDLVISRGSIPFWKDPAKGLSEIYRVMKKGGKAYVGGGKGSPEILEQINKKRQELGMKPFNGRTKQHGDGMKRDYAALLESVGITQYKIHQGDDGRWIEMWK
ncbi:MAG: class I SAM-dependent methyltransferase [Thiovulaceae bacterium]|jgi:ubiquinone/menaquinone biosynthesis C-methylase UbiE|nr:class I SAM-dependent methyltransferase [Sulfurimonadaceae bacterium]MDD3817663.1 class I SAM-dependent methyltransferase [Sulfurimonadaceae bacterium]